MKGFTKPQQKFKKDIRPLHVFKLRDAAEISHLSPSYVQKLVQILVTKRALMQWEGDLFGTPGRFYNLGGDPRNLEHEVACSQVLLKFLRADPSSTPLSEEELWSYHWGIVPDFGLRYNGKVLLIEFCSASNVALGQVTKKVNKYQQCLPQIRADLDAEVYCGIIMDVTVELSSRLLHRLNQSVAGTEGCFFTTYDAFNAGQDALRSPIYLFNDGTEVRHPLRGDPAIQ